MRINLRSRLLALATVTVLLAGCGGGAPTSVSRIPPAKQSHGTASIIVGGLPGTVTEYDSPFEPIWMTVAPDGNAWFQSHDSANRITPAGAVNSYATIGIEQYSEYQQMALGSDGAMWFTATVSSSDTPQCTGAPLCNTIARVAPDGSITRVIQSIGTFQNSPLNVIGSQDAVAAGPNDEIWVAFCAGPEPPSTNPCGRFRYISIRTDGTIDVDKKLPLVDSAGDGYRAWGMSEGPDGAIYMTAGIAVPCPPSVPPTVVFRIDGRGDITRTFPVPDAYFIATGPDGDLWVTQSLLDKVMRVTTSGAVTEYSVPTPNAGPNVITAGNDGAMWFTEFGAGQIGRITTDGEISEYTIPTPGSHPAGIASLLGEFSGGHGRIWFAEQYTNKIGKIEF